MRQRVTASSPVAGALLGLLLVGCGKPGTPIVAGSSGKAAAVPSDAVKVVVLPPHLYTSQDSKPLRHSLLVKNDGERAVGFDRVESSCGCTSAKLPQDQLAPGESMDLPVEIRPDGSDGLRSVLVSLVTNEGERWRYRIEVQAYPRAAFESPAVVVAPLDLDEAGGRECLLVAHGTADDPVPHLLDVSSDSEALRVDVAGREVEEIGGGVLRARVRLELRVAGSAVPGPSSAKVTARLGVSGEESAITVPMQVQWSVRSHYLATPARIFLGDLDDGPEGDVVERRVSLRHADGREFRVVDVESRDPAVTCRLETDGAASSHTLSVRVHAGQVNGHLWTEVRAVIEDDRQPWVSIPVAVMKR